MKLATEDEDLTGSDPAILRLVIEYLYTSEYHVRSTHPRLSMRPCELMKNAKVSTLYGDGQRQSPADNDRILTIHAKVSAAAEKLGIPCLKMLSCHQFETFWSFGEVDNQYDIADAIRVVYSTILDEVRELRNLVEDQLKNKVVDLRSKIEIKMAVESVDGLAWKMFLQATRAFQRPSEYSDEAEAALHTFDVMNMFPVTIHSSLSRGDHGATSDSDG